jgi:hypothetical protein
MSHFTPICYCCYDREEMFDDDDLADYDEGDEDQRQMIDSWLELMVDGASGILRPLTNYVKGAGADVVAKTPDLRGRLIAESRLYVMAHPSEENRTTRMEMYHAIRALRAHNPNWVE